MKKVFFLLCGVLAGAMVASADNFNFTYNGAGLAVSGVMFSVPQGSGQYLVTDITGVYNGDAITGIVPISAGTLQGGGYYLSADNAWYYDNLLSTTFPYVDYYGILFTVANVGEVNLWFSDPVIVSETASETMVVTDGSLVSAPEPGTLLMLGSGILGLAGILRRKLML